MRRFLIVMVLFLVPLRSFAALSLYECTSKRCVLVTMEPEQKPQPQPQPEPVPVERDPVFTDDLCSTDELTLPILYQGSTPLRFCLIPFRWTRTFVDFLGGNF